MGDMTFKIKILHKYFIARFLDFYVLTTITFDNFLVVILVIECDIYFMCDINCIK